MFGRILKGAAIVSGAAAAAAAGWIAYSQACIDHQARMRAPIPVEPHLIHTQAAGEVALYEDLRGSGRPLVLVHSVNAAASAYEMSPIFACYRGRRPVVAIDLPGFGLSERGRVDYTPRLYQEALLEAMRAIGGESADVVALSLGCEFAARAAVLEPERFHSLVMISPSGLSAKANQPSGTADELRTARRLSWFSQRLWARPLFDLIATRVSIRYFLQLAFTGEIPEDLIDFDYAAAHQPGAENAPLSFISGRLFTRGIANTFYAMLTMPVLVVYDQDSFSGFAELPDLLCQRQNWRAVRIAPTRGLPQFEQADALVEAMDTFWAETEEREAE
jgi:pimeloyl-ACP methyl ester carboxylesterase